MLIFAPEAASRISAGGGGTVTNAKQFSGKPGQAEPENGERLDFPRAPSDTITI
jgi:hypothetical protein